jgi:hypothetical protein
MEVRRGILRQVVRGGVEVKIEKCVIECLQNPELKFLAAKKGCGGDGIMSII